MKEDDSSCLDYLKKMIQQQLLRKQYFDKNPHAQVQPNDQVFVKVHTPQVNKKLVSQFTCHL